ncbi:uncharacterized protein C2845_PM01G33510 [Panicum miliaceum]|uniref:Uncharacterized protein n=1 Tax=Panicum miliaceum TaxID=4540 RepID=A0A3L6TEM4_PANMI|nr:uncharacterized protein C2845_PM01G33510 [Panicum miliaceum]
MGVSAGLRQPPVPAAAASLRGCRSVRPPPRAAFPSTRSVSRAVKVASFPSSPPVPPLLARGELPVPLGSAGVRASAINGLQRSKSNLESLFCYDKSVPEEDIGKPTGLNVEKKNVGDNPTCTSCEAKGAVLCATCAGSGLYVDSILESQGIIVKVRCLGKQDRKHFVQQLSSCSRDNACSDIQVTVGCGGTGNIMCSKCGGRGHT